ncbi:GGDEF domain-containing protein [Paraburkholderia sp. J12]|uniref:GGDEF domain-containing protein n=1 Tax=Paraburkholderia sp. J12 TaxID=2805432 RepID=UPI002ABD826C|nr:GGDEF domain-containing protein [Paraburkholderia sp. J12]
MSESDTHSSPGNALLRALPKDPEKEQAVLRISLGSVVLLGYLLASSVYPSAGVYATLLAVLAYVAFGVVTYIVLTVSPKRSRVRLAITTFADQGIVIAALAVGGAPALPLLWVVFWFLVGAGCRYGQRMLALSCGVAVAGLLALMHWQPWWRANVSAALGVTFSVVTTSLYLAVLVYRLERQASTDPLTGLYNRVRLEQAIGRTLLARGAEADRTAMLLVDLDGFKAVNDSFGHAVGDELLCSFATALVRRMRRGDTLARLGGDEFVVLARHVYDRQDALAIADSIHAILANLRSVGGYPVAVSCSIGVCLLTDGAAGRFLDARTLMRAVDSAMYRAKSRGMGKTEFADMAGVLPGVV